MFWTLALVFCLYLQSSFADEACVLGDQTGCSTAVALGLTNQIARKMTEMGHTFSSLNATWISCQPPCVNALQAPAAKALALAAATAGQKISLNSAFRSSAQQYLLYSWYQKKICGIPLAALPGKSNHEGGRAIDTSSWISRLDKFGWKHTYPSNDPVHFDYVAAPNLAKENLIAFQKLYNQHNSQKISEDGVYGPATAAAFAKSPCGGCGSMCVVVALVEESVPILSTVCMIKESKTALAKKIRTSILLAHLLDSSSHFAMLPKELVQIIITTGYLHYEVVRNMTKFGSSGGANYPFAPNTLHSEHGTMSTSVCDEHRGKEIIAWEVHVDASNSIEGHLRLGVARMSNLSELKEKNFFSMFLGNETIKSNTLSHLFTHEYVLGRDILNSLPNDSKFIIHNKDRWDEFIVPNTNMGYLFDRRKNPKTDIYIFKNRELIAELRNAPLEEPMEWIPSFSVGPQNQITLCQEIQFDALETLLYT